MEEEADEFEYTPLRKSTYVEFEAACELIGVRPAVFLWAEEHGVIFDDELNEADQEK